MSTNSRQNRRRKTSLLSTARWAGYAAAGAATALCSHESANAAIHYFDLGPDGVHVEGNLASRSYYGIDLDGAPDGLGEVVIVHKGTAGGGGYAYVYGYPIGGLPVEIAGSLKNSFFYAARLTDATRMYIRSTASGADRDFSATATMAMGTGFGNDEFLDAAEGFIGFKFDLGNGEQFGWVRVIMDGAPLNAFTIMDYAYGDVGENVYAGQMSSVPEPGSLGLLATGGIGLLLWRRKRLKSRKSD